MTQIKPRYRLGCQFHLDLAKDDATKIPERTLFRTGPSTYTAEWRGLFVARISHDYDDLDDRMSVRMDLVDGSDYEYFRASDLQPLI